MMPQTYSAFPASEDVEPSAAFAVSGYFSVVESDESSVGRDGVPSTAALTIIQMKAVRGVPVSAAFEPLRNTQGLDVVDDLDFDQPAVLAATRSLQAWTAP